MNDQLIQGDMLIAGSQNVKQRDYWLNKLLGNPSICRFPYDHSYNSMKPGKMETAESYLKGTEHTNLKNLCKDVDHTLHVVLVAVLLELLQKYTGNSDILLISPIYNQETNEQLINTALLLRTQVTPSMTFRELLIQTRQTITEAVENQDYPLEILSQRLNMKLYEKKPPLTDIAILLENIHDRNYIQNLSHNLLFSFFKTHDSIRLILEYNSILYQKTTVERIVIHFWKLLKESIASPTISISDMEILFEEEKQQLLFHLNNIEVDFPKNKIIHEIFEDQSQNNPDSIALVGKFIHIPQQMNECQVSYGELNKKSNQIARHLRTKGVRPDAIIALMMDRTVEMIATILAVLKAGGAYLPIEPDIPDNRIIAILKDATVSILIIDDAFRDKLTVLLSLQAAESAVRELSIVNPLACELAQESGTNLEHINHPSDLAYVIFTSGSTGKPKGVLIEHINVVRLLFNEKFSFDFDHADIWSMFHSYSFDFSVWEMYGALLYGGKLVIISKVITRDTKSFLELVKIHGISILNQTPTAFYHFLFEELRSQNNQLKIRYIIFGGEALKPSQLHKWNKKYPGTKLINMFGITETTVHVTYKEIGDKEIDSDISNIGIPIPTLGIYIMDKQLKLLPMGVPGEICVGGLGVSRGYLNRVDLTHEKFPYNPYILGQRLYCSGDWARLSNNGELEYLGRMDHQVKIRGFRIELGEIEKHLLKNIKIKEAVVTSIVDNSGDCFLCAYIVTDGEFEASELKEYLSGELPEYMIPAYFVSLDKIPLTSNGKVDKEVLPYPDVITNNDFVSPRNMVEVKMTEIWSEVLCIQKEKLGIDADFFHLGGHSLKATVLIGKIHREFNVRIPVVEIFKMSTIRELAEHVKKAVTDIYKSITPAEEREYYPMSSAQKRMFISHLLNKEKLSDNTPQILAVEGHLEKEFLETIIKQLIKRHETLRTSFKLLDGIPVQFIHKEVDFQVEYIELINQENEKFVETVITNFIRVFDLETPPLIRVGLVKLSFVKYLLMFDMHHIINDGVSMKILFQEFINLYEDVILPELRIQYKDFTLWQDERMQSGLIQKQEKYWRDLFSDKIPTLNMPTDFPRLPAQSYDGDTIDFELDKNLTCEIDLLVIDTAITHYIFFLAAFNILLSKYSAQDDIVVGTSIAGRPHADLQQIIGFFVNTLAMRNYPRKEQTISEFLDTVKANAFQSFENQDFPFDELIKKIGIKRDPGRNPLFDFHFTFQNVDNDSFYNQKIKNLFFEPYDFKEQTTQFDIIVHAAKIQGSIVFKLRYCIKLFKRMTIENFVNNFKKIVTLMIENRNTIIADMTIFQFQAPNLIHSMEGDGNFNFEL